MLHHTLKCLGQRKLVINQQMQMLTVCKSNRACAHKIYVLCGEKKLVSGEPTLVPGCLGLNPGSASRKLADFH